MRPLSLAKVPWRQRLRRSIIAGNWKMNNTLAQGLALVGELKPLIAGAKAEVVLVPPFTALHGIGAAFEGSSVKLGGQNLFWEKSGAWTGQISAAMLIDCGCSFVVLGHSESRGRFGVPAADGNAELLKVFGDTDTSVNRKARTAIENGLTSFGSLGLASLWKSMTGPMRKPCTVLAPAAMRTMKSVTAMRAA